MNSADDYRAEADRAKRMAELAEDPEQKRKWLILERGYRDLAKSLERARRARDS